MNSRHFLAFACSLVGLGLALAAGCSRPVVAGPRPDPAVALKLREQLSAGGAAAEGAKPEDAAAEGPVEWGTLHGVFKFAGQPPTPAPIAATKDPEVCGKHPLVNESITVGPGGGLANVILFLRTPKVPVNPEYDKTAKDEVLLDNKNCRFEPHVLAMRTTQTLLIKNSDPIGHNSKLDLTANASINALIPSGQSAPEQLTKEESLPKQVGCNIHPWMGAWLLVRSDPYASVSNPTGEFKIENLPANRPLEFQVWQEKGNMGGLAFQGGKTDTKGRFKIKLKPGDNDLGTIEVQASAF